MINDKSTETKGFIIQNAVRLPSGKIIYSRYMNDVVSEEGIEISGGHSSLTSNLVPIKYFDDHLVEGGDGVCLFPEDDYRLTTASKIDNAVSKILVEFFDEIDGSRAYYYVPAVDCNIAEIRRYIQYLIVQRQATKHSWFIQIINAKIMLLDFVMSQKVENQPLFS